MRRQRRINTMLLPTVLLLAVVVVAGVASAAQDHCPPPINLQIQACVHPVGEYAKMLNNNQSSSAVGGFSLPNMGSKVFNDLCKLVGKFDKCVKDLRVTCPRHITIGLIESSYGYLCHDGYNVFLESAECLMELDRKPEVKACHDQTLHDIERANSNPDFGLNEKVDKMCSALNFFSGCVKHPIRTACGPSAWQVIHRVLKDTTKTLMPSCMFGRSVKPSARTAVIEEDEAPPHHSAHHTAAHATEPHRHSEVRSHGTRAERRKSAAAAAATSTPPAAPGGDDFVVDEGGSEDYAMRTHAADAKLISPDVSSDFYSLTGPSSSTSLIPSLVCLLLALVTLRLR